MSDLVIKWILFLITTQGVSFFVETEYQKEIYSKQNCLSTCSCVAVTANEFHEWDAKGVH